MKRLILIGIGLFSINIVLMSRGEEQDSPYWVEKVDFFHSMGWHDFLNEGWKQKFFFKRKESALQALKRLHILKEVYDKNIITQESPQREPVIPKIIHQIWVGPHTPPDILAVSQESIKRLHPDWDYRLWTDADIPGLELYNKDIYDLTKNYGAKADILRYELLQRYGGVYIDVDFICTKPLDNLCQYDFWVGVQPLDCKGEISNAIIGSIPGHPIINQCVLSLNHSWHTARFSEGGGTIVESVGPVHLQRSFMKFIKKDRLNVIAFPAGFFFPLGLHSRLTGLEAAATDNPIEAIQPFLRSETRALHLWKGSWWGAPLK